MDKVTEGKLIQQIDSIESRLKKIEEHMEDQNKLINTGRGALLALLLFGGALWAVIKQVWN